MPLAIEKERPFLTESKSLLRDGEISARVRRSMDADDDDLLVRCESFVHLLKTYGVLQDRMHTALASMGLSLAKLNLLILLRNAPDRQLPMSEVGLNMSVTCANITKLVDGLEREELVRRANLPGDRRVVLAQLTDAGEILLQKALPAHYENVRRMWGDLTEADCLQLIHLMMKLRANALAIPSGECEAAASR